MVQFEWQRKIRSSFPLFFEGNNCPANLYALFNPTNLKSQVLFLN